MRDSSPSGSAQATIVALIVVAAGLGLAGFALWNESQARALIHSPLSDMRQLQTATQQMTLDQSVTGGNIRWTCRDDTPMPHGEFIQHLVDAGYLARQDIERILSLSRRMDGSFGIVKTTPDAYNIFAVTESDPDNTLFSATRNWHGPNSTKLDGEPLGSGGFYVFKKEGSGWYLNRSQISDLALIGGGGKFNYQTLK